MCILVNLSLLSLGSNSSTFWKFQYKGKAFQGKDLSIKTLSLIKQLSTLGNPQRMTIFDELMGWRTKEKTCLFHDSLYIKNYAWNLKQRQQGQNLYE